MSGSLMSAKLVWDGGDEVRIPESMGTPRDDQMQGTAAERLTELAGRICYDSLGKGRPSFSTHEQGPGPCRGMVPVEGYHDHITAVGHGSVREHFNFTVEIDLGRNATAPLAVLLNRPGLFVAPDTKDGIYRLTLNLRTLTDWGRIVPIVDWYDELAGVLKSELCLVAHELAPHIIEKPAKQSRSDHFGVRLVEPGYFAESWVSLYMSGSRGFSHEQVRHGDWTAISQRSTRYVDESESPWVEHPLVSIYLAEIGVLGCKFTIETCQETYRKFAGRLESWLIARDVDKGTARKQARGAARGYLGNALQTEMIFSASVAQWKWMLRQRCSVHADAEIRLIYNDVLRELKSCRYAESFAGMELVPSPDGIGCVLTESAGVAA